MITMICVMGENGLAALRTQAPLGLQLHCDLSLSESPPRNILAVLENERIQLLQNPLL
jgi:hypothetical protein